MNFQEQKKKQLNKKDKSNIGEWDEKIKELCDKINKNKKYYTTSSCSGRVVLLKGSLNKEKNKFLYRNHDKLNFKDFKKDLINIDYNGLIEFKQSSCILHIACKDLKSAMDLVDKAKLSGWKHSGIISIKKRIIIELHSTETLGFPIMKNKKILIEDDFLKILIHQVNLRFDKIWDKIRKLKERV